MDIPPERVLGTVAVMVPGYFAIRCLPTCVSMQRTVLDLTARLAVTRVREIVLMRMLDSTDPAACGCQLRDGGPVGGW